MPKLDTGERIRRGMSVRPETWQERMAGVGWVLLFLVGLAIVIPGFVRIVAFLLRAF